MTVRVPMGPGAATRLIASAWLFATDARLADDTADRLAIVVEEWVTNIAEHSGAPPGSAIVLKLQQVGLGVRLTVTDAGVAFDPRTAEDKGPNLERGGGAGIALIRAWSEIEDYQRLSGRNRLVIRLKS